MFYILYMMGFSMRMQSFAPYFEFLMCTMLVSHVSLPVTIHKALNTLEKLKCVQQKAGIKVIKKSKKQLNTM